MSEETVRLGWLIDRLSAMAAEHGPNVRVFIHDADTDWAMDMDPESAVRFGKDDYGYGVADAVMLAGAGYGRQVLNEIHPSNDPSNTG